MKEFCERVKRIMRERKLTQTELSARSGVPAPSLCRYLRGDTEPRIDIVRSIARALGVAETYLLGLDDETHPVDERQQLKQLVARNRHILTEEEKNELVALLYDEDDDTEQP